MHAVAAPLSPSQVLASIVLSLIAVASAAGQSPGYTYTEQPWGRLPQPLMTAVNLPRIGTTFQVQVVRSGAPISTQFLLTGATNPNLQIGLVGFGTLFTSAEVVLPVQMGSASAVTIDLPIPNSTSLVGLAFHQQVLNREAYRAPCLPPAIPCTWFQVDHLSRGGHGVIGR